MKRLLTIVTLAALVTLAGVAAAQKEQRGVTKTEIVLGMHTDLSGPAATYGVSSSNAVKMRFDEVNEKGGIQGRKIRLIVEDTQYQVPRAVQAGAKLINRDHIFAMVEGLGTPMTNTLFKDQGDRVWRRWTSLHTTVHSMMRSRNGTAKHSMRDLPPLNKDSRGSDEVFR